MKKLHSATDLTKGRLYALLAYGTWGFVPLYWTLFRAIPSMELLAHRVLWSLLFLSIVFTITHKWTAVRELLADRKKALGILGCGLLLAANWGTYLFAVNNGRIVDSSLGYFITPFVNVIMGILIFRERMSIIHGIAVALAAIGVIYMTITLGVLPWIALVIAATFGGYGVLKKRLAVDSNLSLELEVMFLSPIALVFLARQFSGYNPFTTYTLPVLFLVPTIGIVTLVPLIWFTNGVQRIPMTEIAMLQYITPSMQLALGVLVFGETFGVTRALSFGCIWAGLILYSLSLLIKTQNAKKGRNNPPQ